MGVFCDLFKVTKLGFIELRDNHRYGFFLIPNGFSNVKLNSLCSWTAYVKMSNGIASCTPLGVDSLYIQFSLEENAERYEVTLRRREESRFL